MSDDGTRGGEVAGFAGKPVQVLVIEPDSEHARRVRELLGHAPGAKFDVTDAGTVDAALSRLAEGGLDAVVVGLNSGNGARLAILNDLRAKAPQLPVIVLSQQDDEAEAVKAVHEGAQDYLGEQGLDSLALERAILCAIERKHCEANLLLAEQKYHGIFDNIVEGIFQTTPDGHYLSANRALARIYGYESPEELTANVTDIAGKLYVTPGRRNEFIRIMEEHDLVTEFESQIYRKDGSVIWISENVRAIRDSRDRLICYEGTVEDITARRDAQERLRDSEALYHSLVETLPQNIFRKDLNEQFTFVNQRFCRALGRFAEEIIGKTDFDFFPPELATKYQRDDRLVIETGRMFESVEQHKLPSGEDLFVQVIKTPLYDAQGRIIGLQGLFWDITEKRRAEEELARNREQLRAKNEQLEDDLRTAREIQQALLPQQYPTFPPQVAPEESALQFCHHYEPTGAVGGDFFNVFALSDTTAGVFICDVMGHGVRSALVTAMVRAMLEELKPLAREPGHLLTQLNQDMRVILKPTGSPLFTTAFYLLADLEAGQLRFANAGHPKPLLVKRARPSVTPLGTAEERCGPALGLFGESLYQTYQCPLNPGDLVLLFTDGLYEVEGPNHVLYNREMLISAVGKYASLPMPELFNALMAEIRQHAVNSEFGDDVCLLGMDVAVSRKAS